MQKEVGISLGFRCKSAVYGVQSGIRKTKKQGYLTCPFDEMISNYPGLLACIADDFEHFCNPQYLTLLKAPSNWKLKNGDAEYFIYNTKYKFIFNHESPGHANLYLTQKWPGGVNHFVANNYEQFSIRYKNRIANFFSYLKDPNNFITFILSRYNTKCDQDIVALHDLLRAKYPDLKYKFIYLEADKKDVYLHHKFLMQFDDTEEELARLNING